MQPKTQYALVVAAVIGAAAAALVLAKWPACTPDRVEKRLEDTARRLGGTTTRNNSFGFGLIDPAKAVAGTTC